MILNLFRRADPNRATIDALYGVIVAQARAPALYRDFGVPDTVMGRFEMVLLHVFLVVDRLAGEPGEGSRAAAGLSQDLVDRFFADMDSSLRELGVGDLAVPKKMTRMAEAWKGRSSVYGQGLKAEGEASLADAFARNVWPDGSPPPAGAALRLASRVRGQAARLAGQTMQALAAGRLDLSAPESAP
jgi:cytochrome b pre-mRNA-processing protein 3